MGFSPTPLIRQFIRPNRVLPPTVAEFYETEINGEFDRPHLTGDKAIQAQRFVRKMRGGAQAHLIQASDGHHYVVKFTNNLQHRRILINEWIASKLLHYIGMTVPPARIIEVTPDFLDNNSEVYLQFSNRRAPVEVGLHFGSRYCANSINQPIYDFLPDTLLPKVQNLGELAGMLAFDKWTGNSDSRQAVFLRTRSLRSNEVAFTVYMIDNGHVFDGPNWRLVDSAIQGPYFRTAIYAHVRGLDAFGPWIEQIRELPEAVILDAIASTPESWIENDREALITLMEKLMRRRLRVAELIESSLSAKGSFPAWSHCRHQHS